MDDMAGLQTVTARDLRLAGARTAQRAAFRQQLRTSATVNRAIDAAAAEQGLVGGVDDRIDVEKCDVAFDDLDHGVLRSMPKARLPSSQIRPHATELPHEIRSAGVIPCRATSASSRRARFAAWARSGSAVRARGRCPRRSWPVP